MKNSKDVTTTNAQLLDKHRPISRINQVLNIDNDLSKADSDTGVETGSETSYGLGSEPNFNLNNVDEASLVSGVLVTKVDES